MSKEIRGGILHRTSKNNYVENIHSSRVRIISQIVYFQKHKLCFEEHFTVLFLDKRRLLKLCENINSTCFNVLVCVSCLDK